MLLFRITVGFLFVLLLGAQPKPSVTSFYFTASAAHHATEASDKLLKPRKKLLQELQNYQFTAAGNDGSELLEKLNQELRSERKKSIQNKDLFTVQQQLTEYQIVRNQLLRLTNLWKVPMQVSRSKFLQTVSESEIDEAELVADRIRTLQQSLRNSYQEFRISYENFFITERLLKDQVAHNPELTAAILQTKQTNGQPLKVQIASIKDLNHNNWNLSEEINGITLIARNQLGFGSTSAELQRTFPHLKGSENAITIYLKANVGPELLSHEFGHLYYLLQRWDEYQTYVAQKGTAYERGGHGSDDPCGQAAMVAEHGEMPSLN